MKASNIAMIIIIILVLSLIAPRRIDGFGTGALVQLYAKGPQDLHLTDDNHVYPYPFYYPWNMPTRLPRYHNYYHNFSYPYYMYPLRFLYY